MPDIIEKEKAVQLLNQVEGQSLFMMRTYDDISLKKNMGPAPAKIIIDFLYGQDLSDYFLADSEGLYAKCRSRRAPIHISATAPSSIPRMLTTATDSMPVDDDEMYDIRFGSPVDKEKEDITYTSSSSTTTFDSHLTAGAPAGGGYETHKEESHVTKKKPRLS